jgi:pyruvate/2-oxoglutarate dehydrogenase complex dihydrolipoamide dehydrogenase (E3) component
MVSRKVSSSFWSSFFLSWDQQICGDDNLTWWNRKNGVDYVKGTGSFVSENEVKVNLLEGGERTLRGKNIIIATGSESTPFPGLEVDEKRIITSTGAL